MIGVAAEAEDYEAVREFFELFKTPWEFYRRGQRYDVLLSTGRIEGDGAAANVVVIYAGGKTPVEEETGIRISAERTGGCALAYGASRLPVYGRSVTFRDGGIGVTTAEPPQEAAAYAVRGRAGVTVRIGYDLFREIRVLLTAGQPPANAGIPALELHIALLREVITWSGVPLVEIPPVPAGYRFMACLTHDVDHPSIRRHKWDRTALGFLYRASVGSVINVWRGRATVRDLLSNWAAAARYPLIQVGLARDFWRGLDRYLEMEADARSTFFVIPVKDYAGQTCDGGAPTRRAARYEAREIADDVRRLAAAGCEIGVHGIDAWLDSTRGRQELRAVSAITGAREVGVRMHWLYGGEKSPLTLERAGFAYDSTSGYNETIGYRAGTTQVFKPLGATRLLELPLHVMDTALFYPAHLNLTPREATERVSRIIDNAVRFGGTVTVNWHDRSVAPERLWGRVYQEVIRELKSRGAWFPTAAEAVSWFRRRRAATFASVIWEPGMVRTHVAVDADGRPPGLGLRVHKAREAHEGMGLGAPLSNGYVDVNVNGASATCVPI